MCRHGPQVLVICFIALCNLPTHMINSHAKTGRKFLENILEIFLLRLLLLLEISLSVRLLSGFPHHCSWKFPDNFCSVFFFDMVDYE
jgi:hypothetical protein